MNRFVLLSTQRSGTSWLMERLAKHPHVGGYGEMLLHPREGWPEWPPGASDRPFFDTYAKDRGATARLPGRIARIVSYLDYLYAARRGFRAIGFKLMYDELRAYPEVWPYLLARRVRVIHLVRTNVLDLLVSCDSVPLRKNAHAWSADQVETVALTIDTAPLLTRLRHFERQRQRFRAALGALPVRVCEVAYEDLRGDDSRLVDVLGFVGIEDLIDVDLSSPMLKLTSESHATSIRNYSEVRDTLLGSSFSHCLRE